VIDKQDWNAMTVADELTKKPECGAELELDLAVA
jgi:hypothetical protein